MAQVYGSAGKSAFAMGDSRYKDMLARIVLPMLSFLFLLPVGYYLLTRGHLLWGIAVAAIYVLSINALETTGLKLKKRISDADTGARAEQAVAEALETLPDDFHVFHDLTFPGFNIDHVVLGPNGIFLVETKSQKGNITQENDVLLNNGRRFFKDFLKQCWSQAFSLRDHLGVEKLKGHRIKPILCFSRGFVEISGPVRGVAVMHVRYLRPFILSQRENIPCVVIEQILPYLVSAVSNKKEHPNPTLQQIETGGIVCPKCFYQRTKSDDMFFKADECPKCGVIYVNVQSDTPKATRLFQTETPKDGPASLFALLLFLSKRFPFNLIVGSAMAKGKSATPNISWSILALKFAACALAALLLTGTYKTIRATVNSIFTPAQTTQPPEIPIPTDTHPTPPTVFPQTHGVSSDNSAKAITFVFEEDRGQNVILLFFDTKAKTLALRACVRANEKLTTTLPRVDLGYIIVTGQTWQGYDDLFGPASEAKKALITLSSQTKTGNVTSIRATSNLFLQNGTPSAQAEVRSWINAAFKKSEFLKR